MKNNMKSLRIVTAFFAIITAGLLTLWVLGVIDNEATKDTIIKLALVSGIAVALSAVLQLLSGPDK